jgi:predicted RND superfamily exporter protein
MVTMVIPSLVLIYGVSDVVHITLRYYRVSSRAPAAPKKELIARAVASSALPCFLTSLTTCLGFLALAPSRVQVLRDLGLLSAAAVLLTFLLTAAFLSVGFSFLAVPRRTRKAPVLRVRYLLGRLNRRSAAVLISAAALFLAMAGGISLLEVDTFSIGFLKPGHPVRRDSAYIESHVGFYTPVEFTMSAGEGSFARPDMLARLQRTVEALEGAEQAEGFLSIVDFLPSVKPHHSPEVIRRFLNRIPDSVSRRFLSSDRRTARITGRVRMAGAAALKDILTDLTGRSPEEIEPAGYLPLYVKIMDYITETQIMSFLIALLTVFGVVAVYARSGRLALFAVLANLFPLGVVLGLMGWAGIRLDIATVTVAAVSIGIVVDDTIHFLHRYKEALVRRAERRGNRETVIEAMEESAGAMVSTSVVLAAGFLALAFAQINSIMYFGLLSASMIACALAGDLLILPALLTAFGRKVSDGLAPSPIRA